MINLRDARITDGLPRIVAEQPWAQVLSAVYGELQDRMFEYLDTGMTFSEVDTCDEGVLDQMAVYLKSGESSERRLRFSGTQVRSRPSGNRQVPCTLIPR